MEIIKQYTEDYQYIIGLLVVLIFLWNIMLSFKLGRLKRRLNGLTRGTHITNLEQVIEKYIEEAESMKSNIKRNTEELDFIVKKLAKYKGKVDIIRYNAFEDGGNDLSYSIAFLDDNKNGLVISSIYNRGESNTYAKPIIGGSSSYKLSREELQVIDGALK